MEVSPGSCIFCAKRPFLKSLRYLKNIIFSKEQANLYLFDYVRISLYIRTSYTVLVMPALDEQRTRSKAHLKLILYACLSD